MDIINIAKLENVDINDQFFDRLKNLYKNFVEWYESHKKGYCYISKDSQNNILAFMCITYNTLKDPMLKIDFLEVNNKGDHLLPFYIERTIKLCNVNGFNKIVINTPNKNRSLITKLTKEYDFDKVSSDIKGYNKLIREVI